MLLECYYVLTRRFPADSNRRIVKLSLKHDWRGFEKLASTQKCILYADLDDEFNEVSIGYNWRLIKT